MSRGNYSISRMCGFSLLLFLIAGSNFTALGRANNGGITPLMAAIKYGAPVSIVRGLHLLTSAAGAERTGDVNHLLAREVDTGDMPLHYAARVNLTQYSVIDALLVCNSKRETKFVSEFRAIGLEAWNTTQCGRVSRAAEVIDGCNERFETPLFVAFKSKNVEAAKRLLRYGANPTIQVIELRNKVLFTIIVLV